MNTDRIFEKARQMGLNIDSSNSTEEKLQQIADQLGVDNFDDIESALDNGFDEEIPEESLYDEQPVGDGVEYLDSSDVSEERQPRFGEEEFNQTEGDKNYYNNQRQNLNTELEDNKKKQDEAREAKEKADQRRQEAKEQKKNSRGSETAKDDRRAYREANRDYKKAKKESKAANRAVKDTKRDLRTNRLNNIKSKMYQTAHPLEAAKSQIKSGAKTAAKNTAKKAGKSIGKGVAKAGKAIGQAAGKGLAAIGKFLVSNPYVLLALVIILLVIFIILLLFMVFGGEGSGGTSTTGYYDPACNFNDTTVVYTNCGNSSQTNIGLSDFVKGSIYAYSKDGEYSDESLKAMMIVIKTNALSRGNYSNTNKVATIDGCSFSYENVSNIPSESLSKINELYESIEGLLYLQSSYKDTITSLTSDDELEFTIDSFSSTTSNYKSILNSIYNSSLDLYDIEQNCTYYNITENDAYWWPIGSESATSGEIYSGTPSTTYVSSGFGWRTVEGNKNYHQGIDIADGGCQDNVVVATKSGTVTVASDSCESYGSYGSSCGGGYGNWVMVDHGDGTSSVYAHLWKDSVAVKNGDTVEQGQKLGLMGSSGSSTGCHLHFEIRIDNTRVDPEDYINASNPRPISRYTLANVDDSGTTSLENKKAICESLLNSGFSTNAVAGMMVNIQAEGNFLTNNLEGCYEENQCCKVNGNDYGFCVHKEITGFGSDSAYTAGVDSGAYTRDKFIYDRAGYGLIQWTSSGRKAGLYDHAKSEGKSIAALSIQLGYLLEELKQPAYAVTYKYITGNYDAYDIANNFCLDFESPANETTSCPTRASNYTNSMLNYIKNGCS